VSARGEGECKAKPKPALMLHFLLSVGDEILTVNGSPLQGLSHAEAVGVFKKIKNGDVILQVARRIVAKKSR